MPELEPLALLPLLLATEESGRHALVEDPMYLKALGLKGEKRTAGEICRELMDLAFSTSASTARDCDPDREQRISRILEKGTLSERILEALAGDFRRESLQGVYRSLSECLRSGRDFFP